MDNNRVKIAFFSLLAIVLIAICVGCFVWGRKSVDIPKVTTEIRWDTVRVEVPVPYKVEKVREVSVPVYVSTPADTVVVTRVDSVLVEVPVDIERREYKSDNYRAVVSGAVIGDYHPSLDEIHVYAKTETKVIKNPAPFIRPYISASAGKGLIGVGGGISIKRQFDVGARYMRIDDKDKWATEVSYRF